jgi:hypothetical protein
MVIYMAYTLHGRFQSSYDMQFQRGMLNTSPAAAAMAISSSSGVSRQRGGLRGVHQVLLQFVNLAQLWCAAAHRGDLSTSSTPFSLPPPLEGKLTVLRCEELGLTSRYVHAIAVLIASPSAAVPCPPS